MYDRHPDAKKWNGWVLFPELRRTDREVRLNYLSAGSIRLAVNKAVEEAMQKKGHLCGQRPSKVMIFVESIDEEYDENGNPVRKGT